MRRSRTAATCTALVGVVFAACLVGDSTEWFSGQIAGPCVGDQCTPQALVTNDCVARARYCTTTAMQAAGGVDVQATFMQCLKDTTIRMPEGPAACENVCDSSGVATALCSDEISILTAIANTNPRCAWHLDDCMKTCSAEGENARAAIGDDDQAETWAGTDLLDQSEAMCMLGSARTSCPVYVQSRQRCGGAFDRPRLDHDSCMEQCDATYGIWHEDSDEPLCNDEPELEPRNLPADATPLQREMARIEQMHQGLPKPGANASDVEQKQYETSLLAETTACSYCRSSCRGSRLADLTLASTDRVDSSQVATQSTPYTTTFQVPEGTARLNVRAVAQQGAVILKVRAPGESGPVATCTSNRECVIRPLYEQARNNSALPRRPRNITTGPWSIEVSTQARSAINFQLVVSTAAATSPTAGQ